MCPWGWHPGHRRRSVVCFPPFYRSVSPNMAACYSQKNKMGYFYLEILLITFRHLQNMITIQSYFSFLSHIESKFVGIFDKGFNLYECIELKIQKIHVSVYKKTVVYKKKYLGPTNYNFTLFGNISLIINLFCVV